jgi:hypothetical protein
VKVEIRLFLILCIFFVIVTPFYGIWNGWTELAGTIALLLTALMMALISWYLHITAKHYQNRPDDNPLGEISDHEGDYGFFTPYSWWPLWLGLSAAIAFAGLAVGWWLFMIGAAIAPIAIVGWTFEHFKGEHAN